MAEERVEGREVTWQRLMPWALLFRAFQVTLDLNKLLLAAAGILVTAFFWTALGYLFSLGYDSTPPEWGTGKYVADAEGDRSKAWKKYRQDRQHWNLMHEAVGLNRSVADAPRYQVEDVAETLEEYDLFSSLDNLKPGIDPVQAFYKLLADKQAVMSTSEADRYRGRAPQYVLLGRAKPAGRLTVGPWSEDRGPNPFLLVSGQAGVPWEAGHFWEWLGRDQLPVMIEPLVKLARPVIYFLSPRNTFGSGLYFLLVTVFTVLTWSFFGGAITRIAAVQVTRGERIGLAEACRFTLRRMVSFAAAPFFPLGVVFVLMLVLAVFGFLTAVTYFLGDVLGALLFPIALLLGLVQAMALVGLVGWPLMAATISTEGTDAWEAVTRAYGYVFQRPWYYAWCVLVSLAYGAVVIFFVGFMGSMTVYLAKWGMSKSLVASYLDREPNYLFVYAPTSFGWRELLLQGTQPRATEAELEKMSEEDRRLVRRFIGADVVTPRLTRTAQDGGVGGVSRFSRIDPVAYRAYLLTLAPLNKFGAWIVAFWLGLVFLLVLGFGYVFFWTACTITYLLLRKSLESAELDEVYMEEEDYEATFNVPPAAAPVAAAVPAAPSGPPRAASLPVVEAPPAPPPAAYPAQAPAAPVVAPAPVESAPAPAVPLVQEAPPPAPPAVAPEPPREEFDAGLAPPPDADDDEPRTK